MLNPKERVETQHDKGYFNSSGESLKKDHQGGACVLENGKMDDVGLKEKTPTQSIKSQKEIAVGPSPTTTEKTCQENGRKHSLYRKKTGECDVKKISPCKAAGLYIDKKKSIQKRERSTKIRYRRPSVGDTARKRRSIREGK